MMLDVQTKKDMGDLMADDLANSLGKMIRATVKSGKVVDSAWSHLETLDATRTKSRWLGAQALKKTVEEAKAAGVFAGDFMQTQDLDPQLDEEEEDPGTPPADEEDADAQADAFLASQESNLEPEVTRMTAQMDANMAAFAAAMNVAKPTDKELAESEHASIPNPAEDGSGSVPQ